MAIHSSVLAWRIPRRGEPGGLPSMGSHRFGHNWSDLAAVLRCMSSFHSLEINFFCSFFSCYYFLSILKAIFQFSSVTQSCLTLCNPMNRSTPGLPVYHQLPEFTQTHVHRFNDAIQPSHPLSSPSPPAPNPSQHQSLFQRVTPHMCCLKYWTFTLVSFLPKKSQGWFSEWPGWISLHSKGLSSLLQHHSSKASILRWSTFFTVQLPHPYMTTGKAIAMTRLTFVGKIMSLLFNMVSRLVITFFFFPQGVSTF